jgi:hypothetical protein
MMSKHHNPRPNVSNKASPDNFNPGEALERLHSELVDVEALAHAAGEVVTLLPSSASPETRRTFARLYALVTRTADEASSVLTLSEQLVSALSSHMAARRATHELERRPR